SNRGDGEDCRRAEMTDAPRGPTKRGTRRSDGGLEHESGSACGADLSVIVPLYNEEANVAPLCAAIHAALSATDLDYEVLLVDDGSSDGTFGAAAALTAARPELRVVKLR